MGMIVSHTDKKTTSWAILQIDSGEHCHISVTRTGVRIKKSKLGLFGKVLFDADPAMSNKVGFILSKLYPEEKTLFKPEMYQDHFVLSTFGNALLHLKSVADVKECLDGVKQCVRNGVLPESVEKVLEKTH